MEKLLCIFLFVGLTSCSGDQNNHIETPTEDDKLVTTNEAAVNNPKIVIETLPDVVEPEPSKKELNVYKEAYNLWDNLKPLEGIEKFKKFIKNHPNSSLADDAQMMIGISYRYLKDYNQAIEEFKKVELEYPESNSVSSTYYEMAHLYFYSLVDFNNAKYYYEKFIISAREKDQLKLVNATKLLEKWDEATKRQLIVEENQRDKAEHEKEMNREWAKTYISVRDHNWHPGGFNSVGLHDFKLFNSSDVTYKDIVVNFNYYSETKVLLGSREGIIYKYLPPKKSILIKEYNSGFIPKDAHSAKVEIITAQVE